MIHRGLQSPALALIASVGLAIACARSVEIVDGGLYSVDDGEGWFRVAKVLVVDGDAVHIRLYKNRFSQRPESVQLEELTLGRVDDPDGFGMGHLPLRRQSFLAWEPKYLGRAPLVSEELEGYEMWKESEGGLF